MVIGFAVSSVGNLFTGLAWAIWAALALQSHPRPRHRGARRGDQHPPATRRTGRACSERVFGNLYGAIGLAAGISYVFGGLLLEHTDARVTFVAAGIGGLLATAATCARSSAIGRRRARSPRYGDQRDRRHHQEGRRRMVDEQADHDRDQEAAQVAGHPDQAGGGAFGFSGTAFDEFEHDRERREQEQADQRDRYEPRDDAGHQREQRRRRAAVELRLTTRRATLGVTPCHQDRDHRAAEHACDHVDQQDRARRTAADSGRFEQRLCEGAHGNEDTEREERQHAEPADQRIAPGDLQRTAIRSLPGHLDAHLVCAGQQMSTSSREDTEDGGDGKHRRQLVRRGEDRGEQEGDHHAGEDAGGPDRDTGRAVLLHKVAAGDAGDRVQDQRLGDRGDDLPGQQPAVVVTDQPDRGTERGQDGARDQAGPEPAVQDQTSGDREDDVQQREDLGEPADRALRDAVPRRPRPWSRRRSSARPAGSPRRPGNNRRSPSSDSP